MKKIFNIMLILLLSGISVYSQCESGYSRDDERLTLSDGCEYDVVVCYNCSPVANKNIKIWAFHKVDTPPCVPLVNLSPAEILAEINTQLMTEAYIRTICNPGIGPCDQYPGGYWWQVSIAGCWYKVNDAVNGLWYIQCDKDRTCNQNWRLCWDPITHSYKYELVQSSFHFAPDACTPADIEPPDPLPGNQTGCFYIKTPCEPKFIKNSSDDSKSSDEIY
jgi:hypothetical protein